MDPTPLGPSREWFTQHLYFNLSIKSSRSIHAAALVRISFPLRLKAIPLCDGDHIAVIPSPIHRHLALVSNAAMNMGARINILGTPLSILFCVCQSATLDHVVILCLIVGGTALPFAATLFHVLTEWSFYSWDFGGRSSKEVETNPGSNRDHTWLFFFVMSLAPFPSRTFPLPCLCASQP